MDGDLGALGLRLFGRRPMPLLLGALALGVAGCDRAQESDTRGETLGRETIAFPSPVPADGAANAAFDGVWYGRLFPVGEVRLDIDGESATVTPAARAGGPIPAAGTAIDGNRIAFDLPRLSAGFEGRLEDGKIAGELSQGGPAPMPLTFARDPAQQPIGQSADAPAFLAAATALLEESPQGNIALVLIDDGEVVGGHYASIGEPVGPDTLFQIASVSKWIAAWGVMALVEDGRIDLDAPVSDYLTRWRLPDSRFDNDGVTVRRLLSHSAGLTDGFGYLGFERGADVQTIEESLTRTADGASNALLPGFMRRGVRVGLQPGAQFRYSGGGYTILQLLVEEVSGQSFNDYMRERVLEPLGMSGSTFVLDEAGEARRADFYANDGSIAPHYLYTALAAASLYTSAEDLTRFLLAHLPGPAGEPAGRGVLRPETLEAMRAPQIAVPGGEVRGLGPQLTPGAGGGWAVGHSGGNRPAISTFAQIDPGSGDGIVMLSTGERDGMRVVREWMVWNTTERIMDELWAREPVAAP